MSAYADGRIEKLFVNYIGAEVVAGQRRRFLQPVAACGGERVSNGGETKLVAGNLGNAAAGARAFDGSGDWTIETARLFRHATRRAREKKFLRRAHGNSRADEWHGRGAARLRRQYVKEGECCSKSPIFPRCGSSSMPTSAICAWFHVGHREVTTPSVPGKLYARRFRSSIRTSTSRHAAPEVRVDLANPLEGDRPNIATNSFINCTQRAHRGLNPIRTDRASLRRAFAGWRAVRLRGQAAGQYRASREVQVGTGRATRSGKCLSGVGEGERVVTTGNLLIDAQAQLNMTARSMSGAAASNSPMIGAVKTATRSKD